jgi:phenylalanyl-tRNA synthetase beta chain
VKISLNWLKDYVALAAPAEDITRAITFLGFEVEQVIATGAPRLDQVVVGEVLARAKHPNADKLSVCQVDVGSAGGVKTIVCGAQNYQVGDRVPVALPGAVLPGNFAIRQSKIRGQLSDGMMCSAQELGLGEDSAGLLLLTDRPALGLPINAVLPAGDTVFDVEITPNRPDCLSHLGLARELAAWFGLDLKYPAIGFGGVQAGPPAPGEPSLLRRAAVEAPEDCPLYTAHLVAGVKIGPSPSWLQARLKAVGLRPVNNVVDVGNYVMLEYGQPLHAFDADQLDGPELVVRRAADGEKLVTLDGKERTLSSRMLVIADASRPVVIAGILGGEGSGIGAGTTNLVIEGAVFRAAGIRWTSRRLGLTSDSAHRFERGVDPHLTAEAVRRALDLIVATAGGRVIGPSFVVGGEAPWKREIRVTTGFIRERLGFDVPDEEMRAALEGLELAISHDEDAGSQGRSWTVAIPSWRDDLDRPIDLVEEVLRLHGTERIPPATLASPGLAAEDDPAVLFNRRALAYLVGHDFHECVNLTLRSSQEVATWVSQAAAVELALANPFVADQSHLRPTLIMGLLETIRLNQSRGVPVTRLAEVGRVFVERNGQNYECAAAAFVCAEDTERRWRRREPVDFYAVKHHVAALAAIAGADLAAAPLASAAAAGSYLGWQEGQAAAAGELEQGWTARFGLLNLAAVRSLGIAGKVYAGIVAVRPETLPAAGSRPRYADFSLFPAALRDLALVVDAETPAAEVEQRLAAIARSAAAPAVGVDQVALFDLYQGTGFPAGKKGLAFSLVFRASDRTLTDQEVNAVFQRVQDELLRTTAFQIRK